MPMPCSSSFSAGSRILTAVAGIALPPSLPCAPGARPSATLSLVAVRRAALAPSAVMSSSTIYAHGTASPVKQTRDARGNMLVCSNTCMEQTRRAEPWRKTHHAGLLQVL